MEDYTYVIIGGGLAAGRACVGLRAVDPEGSVAVVTDEPYLPYERIKLSKGYLTGSVERSKLLYRDSAYYFENRIDVLTEVRATGLDRAARTVTLSDGRSLRYARLLLATGASALRLPIPGADLPGVHTLRTVADADALRSALSTRQNVVVIGGSFIGAETAASLAQMGARVTVVFRESHLMARVLPVELAHWIEARFVKEGVRLIPDAGVTTLAPLVGAREARVGHATLTTGETLPADLVVMGVGVRLNTSLARDAGLTMTDGGAIEVDERLRTSDPAIYAAGDIAAWPDITFGRRLRVEHWDVARNQGFRAGRNMAGESRPYTALPYFFSDLFDLSFDVWGSLDRWERIVWRGAPDSAHMIAWYFAADRLCGALAMGRPEAEQKPIQALVRARPAYDAVAAKLADESTPLESIAGA